MLGVIVLALLLGIPYAASRSTLPLDAAAWETPEGRTRIVVVAMAAGLAALAVLIALVATIVTWMRHANHQLSWSMWSLASVAHALGIACHPYWLNGVATAPNSMIFNALDPKRVAPFLWFRSWFDLPEGLVFYGMVVIFAFTPFITARVIWSLVQRRWSWPLAAEAALPLAWLCLHRSMLQATGWSLD